MGLSKVRLLVVVLVCAAGGGMTDVVRPAGSYLDQEPPGMTPRLFAPGRVSTDANELNSTFSPDGSIVVFTEKRSGRNTLMAIRREGDSWGERTVLPFSGNHADVDPVFSSDGEHLYFSSKRPSGAGDRPGDSDLWSVAYLAGGIWAEPVPVDGVNSPDTDEYYTSISARGALYLSIFPGQRRPGDIFVAEPGSDGFMAPVRIGEPVNTEYSEHDPFIAPDESYLIFTSDRPGGHGRGDLWIVFRNADGRWSEAVNMGPAINSAGYDFCPLLSPDRKYLFFTRYLDGDGDIYWVDAGIVEKMRPGSVSGD